MNINLVQIGGHIGGDPEIRRLESGAVVVHFSVATNETYTDKQGRKISDTQWHRIEFWGKRAEAVEKYFKKGDRIFVQGQIKYDKFKDKEGREVTLPKIKGFAFNFIEKSERPAEPQQNYKQQTEPQNQPQDFGPVPDDDLPF